MAEAAYFIDVLTDEQRLILAEALDTYWDLCETEIRRAHTRSHDTAATKWSRRQAIAEELERRCRA